jgi:hypothetical protein
VKELLNLKINMLEKPVRLGVYDFDGFPANAVLREYTTGKLWCTDNSLCGNKWYDLREVRNGAIEVQSGAYVYYPARSWVHEHFEQVGIAVELGGAA